MQRIEDIKNRDDLIRFLENIDISKRCLALERFSYAHLATILKTVPDLCLIGSALPKKGQQLFFDQYFLYRGWESVMGIFHNDKERWMMFLYHRYDYEISHASELYEALKFIFYVPHNFKSGDGLKMQKISHIRSVYYSLRLSEKHTSLDFIESAKKYSADLNGYSPLLTPVANLVRFNYFFIKSYETVKQNSISNANVFRESNSIGC